MRIFTCSPEDMVKICWSAKCSDRNRFIRARAAAISCSSGFRKRPRVPSKPLRTICSPVHSVSVNCCMQGLTQAMRLRNSTRLVQPKRLPRISTCAP